MNLPFARIALREGERAYRKNSPDLSAAEASFRKAIAFLDPRTADPHEQHALGTAWMSLGNVLLHGDEIGNLESGITCYDRAIPLLEPLVLTGNAAWIADVAAVRANRGHALLRAGSPRLLPEAEGELEKAIEIIKHVFPTSESRYLHNLAGMWFNLGQVKRARQDPKAILVFEQSLKIISQVPENYLQGNLVFLQVCLNLGNAFWEIKRDAESALRAFDEGLKRFSFLPEDTRSSHLSLNASLLANSAHVLAESDRVPNKPVQATLELVRSLEHRNALAAELGLIARRARALHLAKRIFDSHNDKTESEYLALQLSDTIDDALFLLRQWKRPGESRFNSFEKRFIQLGLEVYARYLPQYLGEFVEELVGSGAELHGSLRSRIVALLDSTFDRIWKQSFMDADVVEMERNLETAHSIHLAQELINESGVSNASVPVSR
ncbi:MAG: hypothetical protein KJT03_11295 [Verrucomicrobiae bacterium]|nr:hypothetical protein [Verrucomicrobiae bacterium]